MFDLLLEDSIDLSKIKEINILKKEINLLKKEINILKKDIVVDLSLFEKEDMIDLSFLD